MKEQRLFSKVLISNSWQDLQLFSETNSGQQASMKCLFSSSCSLASWAMILAATSRSTLRRVLPCQMSQRRTPTTIEIHTLRTPMPGAAHFRRKHSGSPIRKQLMRKWRKASWCLPREREMAEMNTCRQSRLVYITMQGVSSSSSSITVSSEVNMDRQGRMKMHIRYTSTSTSRMMAPLFMYSTLLRRYCTRYLATLRQVTTDTPVKMKQPMLCMFVPIMCVEISSLAIDTVWNVKVSQAKISRLSTMPLGSRVLASSTIWSLVMDWKCSVLSQALRLVMYRKKFKLKMSVRILAITAPQLVYPQNLNRKMHTRMWNTLDTIVEISWLLKLWRAFIRDREIKKPELKKMLMMVYSTMLPAKALASSSSSIGKMKLLESIRKKKMGTIIRAQRMMVRWQMITIIYFLRVDSRDSMPADRPSQMQYPKQMVHTRTNPQEDWAATELYAPRKYRLMMLGICSSSSSAATIPASDRSSLEEGDFDSASSWLMKEIVDTPSHESFSRFSLSLLSIFQAVDHIRWHRPLYKLNYIYVRRLHSYSVNNTYQYNTEFQNITHRPKNCLWDP